MSEKSAFCITNVKEVLHYFSRRFPLSNLLGFFVFNFSVLGMVWIFAHDWKQGHDYEIQMPAVKPVEDDLSWIKELLFEYEELHWLTREEVSVTPENSVLNPKQSYSFRLFGKNFPEFDRTVMSLNCLHFFLDGKYEDYLELVYMQPQDERLKWNSFLDIQRTVHAVLENLSPRDRKELRKVMEVALIIGDVAKTRIAQDLGKKHGVQVAEFDKFCMTVIKHCSHVFPSFEALSKHGKDLLLRILPLRSFGYIAHLEGGAELFSQLKTSNILFDDPDFFELAIFLHQCDVGGALGHVDSHSAIAYSESTHQIIQAVREACYMLKTEDEQVAYDHYLSTRAEWLGFDIASPLNRVLTRIGAMLRLTKFEEGKMLKDSFLKLAPDDLTLIVEAFNLHKSDHSMKTPMYIPAVLANLLNNQELGAKKQERLAKSIHVGLPFIAKVIRMQKEQVKRKGMLDPVTLNFAAIAKVARDHPLDLLASEFQIESGGQVLLDDSQAVIQK